MPYWKKAFPNLVSYTRFVELMPWSLMLLCCFLNTCKIETVNDQLKNIFQIEHSRHRSIWNFLVNLMAGLIAYTGDRDRWHPKRDQDNRRSHSMINAIFSQFVLKDTASHKELEVPKVQSLHQDWRSF